MMLNNTESAIISLNFTTLKSDFKINLKLYKSSEFLGTGEFPITSAILSKKEEAIKKWIMLGNYNTKQERKNGNLAMNLINSIRIHLKASIIYNESINMTIPDKTHSGNKNNSNSKQNLSKIVKKENISKFSEKNKHSNEENTINNHSHIQNRQNINLNNMSVNKSAAKNLNMSCGNIAFNSLNEKFVKQKNSATSTNVNSNSKYNKMSSKTEKHIKNVILNKPKEENKKNMTEGSKNKNRKIFLVDENAGFVDTNEFNNEELATENNNDNVTKEEEEKKKDKCNDSDILNMTSNSFIDQIFHDNSNEENINSEKLANCINEFKLYYNDELMKVLPNDSDLLKFEAKMLAEKFLEMQDYYYSELKETILNFRNFKKFYFDYNEKFRHLNKKHNVLKEALETNHIKTTKLGFIHKEEDKRINECLSVNKDELNLYNILFNTSKDKNQVKEFVKIEKENYNNDKNKLFSISEKIFDNPKLMDSLTNGQRMIVNRLLNKNDKPTLVASPNEETSNISLNNFNRNYNSNPHNETDPMLLSKSNFFSGPKNENLPVLNLNIINTDTNDVNSKKQSKTFLNIEIDDKLRENVKKINSKLNKDQIIEFKKISEAIYEYGGSNVIVIMDNNDIKGKLYLKLLVNHSNKLYSLEEFMKTFNKNSIKNAKKETNGLTKLNSRSFMKSVKEESSTSPLKLNYPKLSYLKK